MLLAGIRIESFGLPFERAAGKAAAAGAAGIMIDSAGKVLNLLTSGSAALGGIRRELESQNLTPFAVSLDCGIPGFADRAGSRERLKLICRASEVAADIGSRMISLNPGRVPAALRKEILSGLRKAAESAGRSGVAVALEGNSSDLASECGVPGIGTAFDPLVSPDDSRAFYAVMRRGNPAPWNYFPKRELFCLVEPGPDESAESAVISARKTFRAQTSFSAGNPG